MTPHRPPAYWQQRRRRRLIAVLLPLILPLTLIAINPKQQMHVESLTIRYAEEANDTRYEPVIDREELRDIIRMDNRHFAYKIYEEGDRRRIHQAYKKRGYFKGRLKTVARKRVNPTTVKLTYIIEEGAPTLLENVTIICETFPQTSFTPYLRPLINRPYRRNKLVHSLSQAILYHRRQGYYDISFSITDQAYIRRRNRMRITVRVDAGKRFFFMGLRIFGLERTDPGFVKTHSPFTPKKPYNNDDLYPFISAISSYSFFELEHVPRVIKLPNSQSIAVVLNLRERLANAMATHHYFFPSDFATDMSYLWHAQLHAENLFGGGRQTDFEHIGYIRGQPGPTALERRGYYHLRHSETLAYAHRLSAEFNFDDYRVKERDIRRLNTGLDVGLMTMIRRMEIRPRIAFRRLIDDGQGGDQDHLATSLLWTYDFSLFSFGRKLDLSYRYPSNFDLQKAYIKDPYRFQRMTTKHLHIFGIVPDIKTTFMLPLSKGVYDDWLLDLDVKLQLSYSRKDLTISDKYSMIWPRLRLDYYGSYRFFPRGLPLSMLRRHLDPVIFPGLRYSDRSYQSLSALRFSFDTFQLATQRRKHRVTLYAETAWTVRYGRVEWLNNGGVEMSFVIANRYRLNLTYAVPIRSDPWPGRAHLGIVYHF